MAGIMLMLVGGKGGDAPVNTGVPVIDNTTPEYGETLTTTNGSWDSITTPTFTYQWQRNYVNISGANSSTYTVDAADVDARLNCRVTATNPFGSNTESTAQTSVVDAAPPDQVATPTAVAGQEQATVTWTELSYPTETGGAVLDRYQVLPSPATGGVRNATGSPFVVTGLIGGTSYTFTVRAENPDHSGPYSSASNSVTPTSPPLGLFATNRTGTGTSTFSDMIQKVVISTTGNATDFGNLLAAREQSCMGASSTTRAVYASGGTSSGKDNVIQYSTFATSGNATDFGDITIARYGGAGGGNATTGLFAGGQDTYSTSRIDKITIASTGNSTNFGNLQDQYQGAGFGMRFLGGTSSTTYAFWWGGESGWDGSANFDLQRTTISSGGQTTYTSTCFGASGNVYSFGNVSSGSRGVCAQGSSSSINSFTNTVHYKDHTTTGGSSDFGDLTQSRNGGAGSSSTTRGVFCGGRRQSTSPLGSNVIDYCTISSTGNLTDFGDLVETVFQGYTGTASDGGAQQ